MKALSILNRINGKVTATLLAIAMSGISIHSSAAESGKLTASVDSAYIMMGRTTSLNLTMSGISAEQGRFVISREEMPVEIEFTDTVPVITKVSDKNGRELIKATYIIQSFDSGDYRIPGIMYIVGNDTIISNAVNLKVVPVEATAETEIVNERVPLDGGRGFFDWLPGWWYWVVIGLLIIAGGILAYLIMSKRIVIKLPQRAPEPPYNVARRELDNMYSERQWQTTQSKFYYTRLTDIVRKYIAGRFDINAPELTTMQTLEALKELNLTGEDIEQVRKLLVQADYVKFAKMQPSSDDNLHAYYQAERFIEDTKPTETQTEDSTGKNVTDDKGTECSDNLPNK